MSNFLEQAYLTSVSVISLLFFGWFACRIIYASNARWREFERFYTDKNLDKPLARKMTGMVRLTQPGFRWGHLSGDLQSHRHPPIMVGVFNDGLSLSIIPPFKYGCANLFLPFKEMTIEPAAWDLLGSEFGVRMEAVDGIEIQMFSNILEWAAERSEILSLMLRRAELVRAAQLAGQEHV